MEKRGGGVKKIELVDKTFIEPGFFQLLVTFETCDAMGANFINSVLEAFAGKLKESIETSTFSQRKNGRSILLRHPFKLYS